MLSLRSVSANLNDGESAVISSVSHQDTLELMQRVMVALEELSTTENTSK